MKDVDLTYAVTLSPADAIAYFRNKGFTFSWDWEDTWQQAHTQAFTVAKAMRLDVLQDIRDAVDRALAEGRTLDEFRRELAPKLKAKGWWGKVMVGDGEGGASQVQLGSPRRLKTIYRTNLQTAYMAGRWKSMMENVADRPYLQYVAVLDARTRPAHRALHGKVFRFDDPFWRSLYPPNGWGCRCRVRARSAADLAEHGLKVDQSGDNLSQIEQLVSKRTGELRQGTAYRFTDPVTGKPVKMIPDVGWSYNPGMAWQQPFASRPFNPEGLVGGYKTVGAVNHKRTPISALPAKPLSKELRLPPPKGHDLAEQQTYIDTFLGEFGAKAGQAVIFKDVIGDPLVISERLFIDRRTGKYKVFRQGRGPYLKMLADTIKDPVEVWLTPVQEAQGTRLCKRYIGLYRDEGGKVGGFAVFDLIDGQWQGTTTFSPKKLDYLDRQRAGTLLYTKEKKPLNKGPR